MSQKLKIEPSQVIINCWFIRTSSSAEVPLSKVLNSQMIQLVELLLFHCPDFADTFTFSILNLNGRLRVRTVCIYTVWLRFVSQSCHGHLQCRFCSSTFDFTCWTTATLNRCISHEPCCAFNVIHQINGLIHFALWATLRLFWSSFRCFTQK